MNFGEKLVERYTEEAKRLGRRLVRAEYVALADELFREATKERKKSGVHPDAERIYELFPKKVGRDAALQAITKALAKNTTEYLLDKTSQFARAVADWPSSYRYFNDGADRCPHPSTWFNEARYADDPSTWKRHGSRGSPPPIKQDLPEPPGWRAAFPDFIHVHKDWHALDQFSQRHIVEAMKARNTA